MASSPPRDAHDSDVPNTHASHVPEGHDSSTSDTANTSPAIDNSAETRADSASTPTDTAPAPTDTAPAPTDTAPAGTEAASALAGSAATPANTTPPPAVPVSALGESEPTAREKDALWIRKEDKARPSSRAWRFITVGALVAAAILGVESFVAGHNGTTASPTIEATRAAQLRTIAATPSPEPVTVTSSAPASPDAVTVGKWSVELLEYNPDVSGFFLYGAAAEPTENARFDKYAGIRLRITNNGEAANPDEELLVSLNGVWQGAEFSVSSSDDHQGAERLSSIDLLETGETAEGWIYYDVYEDFTPASIQVDDNHKSGEDGLDLIYTSIPIP